MAPRTFANWGLVAADVARIDIGSVVTRDLPARVLAVGNPARILRAL